MNAPLDKRTTTNMTSKGQVLIPKEVREAIGLVPGAQVDVGLNDRGQAVVSPSRRLRDEPASVREARIDAAFAAARALKLYDRPTEVIMRELRGDEPLP